MALHFGDGGTSSKKVVGSLRRAQLITTFGSGAIASLKDGSVIMAGTDYWNTKNRIHEVNLERLLKVRHFCLPYTGGAANDVFTADIPAFRFPYLHFCPKCGKLLSPRKFGESMLCPDCKVKVVPSRFVAACVNGHLEDFPYYWWVHGFNHDCPSTWGDGSLVIEFSKSTGSLEGIEIHCTKCGRKRTMAGALGREALKGYPCRGKRPWLGGSKHDDEEKCYAPMRALQRGGSNVYFPQTVSALTIPPYSSELNQLIEANWEAIKKQLDKNRGEEVLKVALEVLFDEAISQGAYTVDDFYREIKERAGLGETRTLEYKRQNLYEDEYQVFLKGDYEQERDFEFRLRRVSVPDFLAPYLADVVMAKRLREVLALTGFRRILPDAPAEEEAAGYRLEDCVPLSEEKLDWLPAMEMRGEGIFIRLREDALEAWAERNKGRYTELAARLADSNVECEKFSPAYVLLHTLAHLFIRALSSECGYSGAALKERIYSSYPGSPIKMAGILVYTATSDSDGSLGGLVRNALPENLGRIFRVLLKEATWCSADPVCIDSKAQGYDSLNYAACHACTLLPETSCEMRNCLLDRGAVVGSLNDRQKGFFGELLQE